MTESQEQPPLSPELRDAVAAILEIGLAFKILPPKPVPDSTIEAVAPLMWTSEEVALVDSGQGGITTLTSPQQHSTTVSSSSCIQDMKAARVTACVACRTLHKKCAGEAICSRCKRRGIPCVYDTHDHGVSSSIVTPDGSLVKSVQDTIAAPPKKKRSRNVMEGGGETFCKKTFLFLRSAHFLCYLVDWKPIKAVSCKHCYLKKIKCDKQRPTCSGCMKRGAPCEYIAVGSNEAGLVKKLCVGERVKSPDANALPAFEDVDSAVEYSPSIASAQFERTPSPAGSKLMNVPSPQWTTSTTNTMQKSPPPTTQKQTQQALETVAHANGKSLVDIVMDRLANSSSTNSKKRLRCGKLWCNDPATNLRLYFCPVCKKEYKTSNGLKYHLNGHEAGSFPEGWYWVNGDDDDAEDGEKKAFPCRLDGCRNSYTSLGGLKYHREKNHGGFVNIVKQSESVII
ncbi:UNVERIFIED_CONTAM: hypothetical protein HDU68_007970 [Siphonaria sp. JEL0065]|nr:hypothetical protein HDU68_007970 [Siphonaria sp. JEL0065]